MDNRHFLKNLFGSETRVALLQELMVNGRRDSALGLSRNVGRSYHPVARELERLVGTGLVQKHRRGAAGVYEKNAANRACKALHALLTLSFDPNGVSDTEVEAALSTLMACGAPLRRARVNRRLPLERALAVAAKYSHQDGTVLRVLPFMLFKLQDKLDRRALWKHSHGLDVEPTMGLLLDLAGRLTSVKHFREWAKDYRDSRRRLSRHYFQPRSSYEEELARRHTPPLMRNWGFYMNVPESDFKDLLRKFL